MRTFVDETEFVVVNCGPADSGGCGMAFAMSRAFYDETKRTGTGWHCPRGHTRIWAGMSVEQELKAAKAQTVHLADQLAAAIRDAEASRQALLRDRERFANGVCPCCHRSFQNVRRHMETKHPDMVTKMADRMRRPRYACSCGHRFDSYHGLRVHQGRSRRDGWDRDGVSRWRSHLTTVDA